MGGSLFNASATEHTNTTISSWDGMTSASQKKPLVNPNVVRKFNHAIDITTYKTAGVTVCGE